jgi:hypothetical protein
MISISFERRIHNLLKGIDHKRGLRGGFLLMAIVTVTGQKLV